MPQRLVGIGRNSPGAWWSEPRTATSQGQWQASYWVRQKLLSSRATQVWSCWGRFSRLRNCSNIGPGITDCSQSNQARSRTETCGKILNNCCNCSTMRGTIAKKPMMRASNTTTVMAMAILRLRYRWSVCTTRFKIVDKTAAANTSKTICRICHKM